WQRPRTSEPGDIDPLSPFAKRAQPAAAGGAHVGPPDLRVEDRKRKSDPDPFLTGTSGPCTGSHSAGSALWRRTQPPGRNRRADERSVHRGLDAVRVPAERDAVVECTGAGPRLDSASTPQRLVNVGVAPRWCGSIRGAAARARTLALTVDNDFAERCN